MRNVMYSTAFTVHYIKVMYLYVMYIHAFYNINFWFKISKICLKISHFSQISRSRGNAAVNSGVKSILKQYLSKSIVTDGKTTRSKVESIDSKKHLSKSKK